MDAKMTRRRNSDSSSNDTTVKKASVAIRTNDSNDVVSKSILDWDLLNKPDSVIGHSFIFVTVMYTFTIASYAYWMMMGKITSFNNAVLKKLINIEILEVLVLDAIMCATSFGSYFIVKSVKKNLLSVERSKYVYTLWIISWALFFITNAYKFEWSWSRYTFFSPHLFSILMKQHAYYISNIKLLGEKSTPSDVDAEPTDESHNSDKKILKSKDNTSIPNYLNFLLRPVFVYEPNYPKTERVRPMYLMWKILSLVVSMCILYVIIEYVVAPLLIISNNLPIWGGALLLSVPAVLCHMLVFYMMFEIVANIFAEITRHADRDFYGVWWGSGDFRGFCRNWNKPVNKFLNTYVYKELRSMNISPIISISATFLISALSHEIVMFTVCKTFSPYIFVTMMFIVPVLVLESFQMISTPYLIALFRYWILFFSVSNPVFLFTTSISNHGKNI